MFTYSWDCYMRHAFPMPELRPLSCSGGRFALSDIPMLTLIDSMDTLLVMGNYSEFRRSIDLVVAAGVKELLDLDINVSVFETTIRVLGGLLSSHLLASDDRLAPDGWVGSCRDRSDGDGGSVTAGGDGHGCDRNVADDGGLLAIATDLGNRLLPAFQTASGIPYGTVNLKPGVPRGETMVSSLAGAGSLALEFSMLTLLTGSGAFHAAAQRAVGALFRTRMYV